MQRMSYGVCLRSSRKTGRINRQRKVEAVPVVTHLASPCILLPLVRCDISITDNAMLLVLIEVWYIDRLLGLLCATTEDGGTPLNILLIVNLRLNDYDCVRCGSVTQE